MGHLWKGSHYFLVPNPHLLQRRYLCAIGLPPVFSFRWNLPPNLSCNPKQLDSLKAHTMTHRHQARTGVSPSQLPFSKELGPVLWSMIPLQTTIRRASITGYADSHGELFLLQSPLLEEFLLVSFPPLNYMLKFRGYSYLIWDPIGLRHTKLLQAYLLEFYVSCKLLKT